MVTSKIWHASISSSHADANQFGTGLYLANVVKDSQVKRMRNKRRNDRNLCWFCASARLHDLGYFRFQFFDELGFLMQIFGLVVKIRLK